MVILFGHMPQIDNGFQPLERQLNLPPEPIALQYLPDGGPVPGQRCEHQHITGVFPVFRGVFAFAILLLSAFPGTILIDKDGIEQVYWLRGRKRIAWNEISKVTTDEKRGEVKIKGRNGIKILFARQLPDRERLLVEVEKHSEESAPAKVAPRAYAMSGPAAY